MFFLDYLRLGWGLPVLGPDKLYQLSGPVTTKFTVAPLADPPGYHHSIKWEPASKMRHHFNLLLTFIVFVGICWGHPPPQTS